MRNRHTIHHTIDSDLQETIIVIAFFVLVGIITVGGFITYTLTHLPPKSETAQTATAIDTK